MIPVFVEHLFVAIDKIRSNEEQERAQNLIGGINPQKIHYTTSQEIEALLRQEQQERAGQRPRTGQQEKSLNVVLTTFDWGDPLNSPSKARKYVPWEAGRFAFADWRDKEQLLRVRGVACNSGYEIHTAFGCFHSCTYCHIGNTFTIMLDIETFIEKLSELMTKVPRQNLYKYDNQTDILTLEPEYKATEKMVDFFSKTNKSLMLYTKSDNVDFLLNLKHQGRTVVCWTMSCSEVAEKYELGAPSSEKRIKAAKKCQNAGYRIRARFSPIIPISGWEQKNKEMIQNLFSEVRPEVVSLESLCHLTRGQYQELFPDLAIAPAEKITEYELFSHEARKSMYEFFIREIRKQDSKVKISLCLETPRMWNDLSGLLKGNARNFYCCCGEKCG